MKMKKIIAMCMCLILMACLVSGCDGKPGSKETLETLERIYGGERFEIDGDFVKSLDRDIEFIYWYKWEGTPIWPDIDINLGGTYCIQTTYNDEVHKYWNDEYRKCIEKQGFADVDYGEDGENENRCYPNLVYIFIENGASSEDLEKVEALLSDLREICRSEQEFHSSKCSEEFVYLAYIWYIDSDAEEYNKTNGIRITANTKDEYLQLDNIKITSTDRSDPRDISLYQGKAKISVTIPSTE